MAMAIDPVCKMKVNESKPAAISEYKGKKYYFLDPSTKIPRSTSEHATPALNAVANLAMGLA